MSFLTFSWRRACSFSGRRKHNFLNQLGKKMKRYEELKIVHTFCVAAVHTCILYTGTSTNIPFTCFRSHGVPFHQRKENIFNLETTGQQNLRGTGLFFLAAQHVGSQFPNQSVELHPPYHKQTQASTTCKFPYIYLRASETAHPHHQSRGHVLINSCKQLLRSYRMK